MREEREIKTAPCGCRYVGNAGLRDVQVLDCCERHTPSPAVTGRADTTGAER